MKVALCAIAKNENNYIREWVEHHLKLNFDIIYLLDNNDIDGEHFEEVIGDYIDSKKVIIINKRGIRNAQISSYDEFYKGIAKQYDWVGFWDIDEFLFLEEDKDIQSFINQKRFLECNTIVINWKYYDDNDLICVENNNYSVLERFKNPGKISGNESEYGKRLVKTNIVGLTINSSHGPIVDPDFGEVNENATVPNTVLKTLNAAGEPIEYNSCKIDKPTHKFAHLRHYRFKTIEEYITNKMKRGYPTLYLNEGRDMNIFDFFMLNEKTDEKLRWISLYRRSQKKK